MGGKFRLDGKKLEAPEDLGILHAWGVREYLLGECLLKSARQWLIKWVRTNCNRQLSEKIGQENYNKTI